MKTILLSGFGPFGNYRENSTAEVSRALNKTIIHRYQIHSIVFGANIPVENRGANLLQAAQQINASGIISLGMGSEKIGLTIELAAENKIDSKYCSPEQNKKPIDPKWRYGYKLPMDITPWNVNAFKRRAILKGIPHEISSTPGAFCCNHLMWQVQSEQYRRLQDDPIPFCFIHVPCTWQCVANPKEFTRAGKTLTTVEEIVAGIQILLEVAFLPPRV